MPKVHVRVTEKLIHWASQQSKTTCAIALAIQDADDRFGFVRVDQNTIRFTNIAEGQRYTFHTPGDLKEWIEKYDVDRDAVAPLEFELDLSCPDSTRSMMRTAASDQELARRRKDGRRSRPGTGGPNSSYRPPQRQP